MLSKSQLKYIQSLHHKKFREEHRAFLVEGTKMAEEALQYALPQIRHIYVVSDWFSLHRHLLRDVQHKIQEVTEAEMEKLTTMQTAPGVLLVLDKPEMYVGECNGLTIILDGIQDPGNLGTIIRTAEWFGIDQIICGSGTAEVFNPKVIQSTMGSIFRVKLFYTELDSFLDDHKDIPVVVSDLNGTDLAQYRWPEQLFLVIGNESKGVSDVIKKRSSACIKIPGKGAAESLNASVAAAILLYAWKY